MTSDYKWIPLESDPQIFNDYFWGIGLNKKFQFQEIYSLDYQDIQPFDDLSVIKGVVVNFLKTKSNDEIYKKENFVNSSNLFYMKQTDAIKNACGLVAGINLICNVDNAVIKGSMLGELKEKKFEDKTKYSDTINKNELWREHHKKFGEQGSTEILSDVKYHYVAFAAKDGKLYELDGRLSSVYECKEMKDKENVLDSVINILRERIGRKEINENLSLMILKE